MSPPITQTMQGNLGLAFEQAMDAVRFCHAAQMQLMYARWPPEAADFYGQSVPSPDGRWVFHGPRVAMAIHESGDFQVGCELGVCDNIRLHCAPILLRGLLAWCLLRGAHALAARGCRLYWEVCSSAAAVHLKPCLLQSKLCSAPRTHPRLTPSPPTPGKRG